VLPTVAANQHH